MGIWGNFIYPAIRYFRFRRLQKLISIYPNLREMSVLDVGGRPIIWELLDQQWGIRPQRLVILNTEDELNPLNDYEWVVGDGRNPPYDDNAFDLVFSNSVIEHVGSNTDQIAFAKECLRVGKNIYIQTPNRWFPIETHLVALFIHWLPKKWFTKLSFLSIRCFFLLSNPQQFNDIVPRMDLVDCQKLQSYIYFLKKIFTVNFKPVQRLVSYD